MADKSIENLEKEIGLLKQKLLINQEDEQVLQRKAKLENEINEKKQKLLYEEIEIFKKSSNNSVQDIELIKAKEEELQRFIVSTNKLNNVEKERVETFKKTKEQVDAVNKALKEEEKRPLTQGKKLANLLGISEDQKNSLTYQMFANPKGVFEGFSKEIELAGGGLKAAGLSIAMKIQEATIAAFKQADAAISSFAAATGGAAKYNDVIFETARGNTALGISFAQSGKAFTDLYQGLNTFTNLNKASQASITITVAKLEKLGITGADSAKSIASLSTAMMVSEESAAKTLETFAAMGISIGVSSKQMVSDFMQVKDQLAVFGGAMDETFMRLAQQAKATGVAVNDLLGLALKFDTFEGASTQVAKLNSVLGGPYLSAMAMLETTDPTERINMIREAVNNSTMSFTSMSYYQKKAIAEAGGFKTVEEAQRILSMSAGKAAEEMQAQAASQEKLNEAIQRAQPIQEKLSMIMANFAVVMQEPVEMLSALLSGILKVMDELPFLGTLLGVIVTAFTTLKIISGIAAMFSTLTGVFSLFAPAAAATTPAIAPLGPVINSTATSLAAATPVIIKASAGLGIFALVLLGVGAAVYMVGLGFKAMFEGFAAVLEQGVKAPDIFLNMAFGILALTAAIYALSINPLAFLGIANLVAAVYGISKAINSIETEKVIAFKTVMEKSVEISEPSTIQGFEKFSEKFEAVVKATAKIDASKTQTFANMLTATQNLSQSLSLNQTVIVKIGSDKFKGVIEKIIDNKMPDNSTSLM